MGRHDRPDTEQQQEQPHPRRLAMAVRHAIPPTAVPVATGLDATTLAIRPVAPVRALDRDVAPAAAPGPTPVPPAGPPGRLSRRDRRAARHEEAARAALAARLSRAERRSRQVAAFVPAPRTPDPSVSGPLAIDPRPPWSAR